MKIKKKDLLRLMGHQLGEDCARDVFKYVERNQPGPMPQPNIHTVPRESADKLLAALRPISEIAAIFEDSHDITQVAVELRLLRGIRAAINTYNKETGT